MSRRKRPRDALWKLVLVAAIGALSTGTAAAQMPMPGLTLNPGSDTDSRPLTKEEAEKKKAREDAYKSALEKIPDKKNTKPADPWGNMRWAAPDSSKTEQGQQ